LRSLSAAALLLSAAGLQSIAAESAAHGLGDPGPLKSLEIDPKPDGQGVTPRGRDARPQVYVTAVYSRGQLHVLTLKAQFTAAPEGVVSVDATGLVTPLADGDATVTAVDSEGRKAVLPVHVEGVSQQIPINFTNQIVPIFTKLGCNSGGCHGKASGQNGFKLSLLGFYPEDDYEFLVKETRGRRIFPPAPDQSLLLTKPIGASPHGGDRKSTRLNSSHVKISY